MNSGDYSGLASTFAITQFGFIILAFELLVYVLFVVSIK